MKVQFMFWLILINVILAVWSTFSILDNIERARRDIREYIDYALTNQKADFERDLMNRIRDLHDLLHSKLNNFEEDIEDIEDDFQEIFEQLACLTTNSNEIKETIQVDEKKELIEENKKLKRKFLHLSRIIKNQEDS